MARRKMRAVVFKRRESEIYSRFGDSGAPGADDECSAECPRRGYLVSLSFESIDVGLRPGPGPGFAWNFKVKGKCRLMVFCLKFGENPRPVTDVPTDPTGVCGEDSFGKRGTTTVKIPFIAGNDVEDAEYRATNQAIEDICFAASTVNCPESCPRTVMLYRIVETNHRIITEDDGQEYIEASVVWDLRVDCVPNETKYAPKPIG